jgi:hypothetical protein
VSAAEASGLSRRRQDVDRLTGSVGAAWRVWHDADGPISVVTLHGNVGYTFQPAQIDFGPDPGSTRRRIAEAGDPAQRDHRDEADSHNGMASFDVDSFFVDLQPAGQAIASGTAVLRSIGQQRYRASTSKALYVRPKACRSKRTSAGAMRSTEIT